MPAAAHITKGGDTTSKAAAHNTGQRKKKKTPTASFMDNRPEAANQRRLQAIMQNRGKVPRRIVQRDVVRDGDPTAVLLDRFNRVKESAQTIALQVYAMIFRASGKVKNLDFYYDLVLNILKTPNNSIMSDIKNPQVSKTITEIAVDLHRLIKQDTGENLLQYKVIKGKYKYQHKVRNPKGFCHLQVFAAGEDKPVGYAKYEIQTIKPRAKPSKKSPYTKEDVLAREGKVAYLSSLFNNTLTRDGPAHIYRGFGATMLKLVEQDAKACGAKLIYLTAAKSDVRTDPNTNDKKSVDPTSFYTKFGYGYDKAAVEHNWDYAMSQAKKFSLKKQMEIKFVQNQVKGLIEGMFSKSLK